MSINPYTLNGLYEQGIIDYVPYDLMMPTPVGTMTPMSNPYLDLAKQGGLYKNYGGGDSFTSSTTNFAGAAQNVQIGSQSNAGMNAYGLQGIGSQSNAGMNAYGLHGIGTHSNAGYNAYGLSGIGSQSNAGYNAYGLTGVGNNTAAGGINAWGGIQDAKNGVTKGFNTAVSVYDRTPSFIKGLVSVLIVGGTLLHFMKRGKKAGTSFLSKINPLNWFKSHKTK